MSRELRCTHSLRLFDEHGVRHVVHEITEFHVKIKSGEITVRPGESHLETIYGEQVEQKEENEYRTSGGLQLWMTDPRRALGSSAKKVVEEALAGVMA